MQRGGVITSIVLAALAAGCSSDIVSSDTRLFPQSVDFFRVRSWSSGSLAKPEMDIGKGPVTAEDYVDANGQCAAVAAATPDPAVATVAGDLGTTSVPAGASPSAPTVGGGIALGMTECQVANRAGPPTQVSIGSEEQDRKVVLTYMSGPWPGIYTFVGGRLKVVDRVVVPEPVKPKAKPKPRRAKPKSAGQTPAHS